MHKTMTRQTAYTRIDLLVTLMCMSVLVICLGAVGLNGREMAKRTVCASNINQNLEALLAYANESDGELPKNRIGGWLHTLENRHVSKFMEQYGIYKEAFYCPSNTTQQRFMDQFYHFNSADPSDPSDSNGYILAGYIFLLEVDAGPPRSPIAGNGDKQWIGDIHVDNPALADLVTDVTLSMTREDTLQRDFQHVPGGLFAVASLFYSSNHLKSEARPWGSNIGYVDGHVSWRPFSEMELRHTRGPDWWW